MKDHLDVTCYFISLLMCSTCFGQASACNTGTTKIQPHQISNTQRTEYKTTDVVIQQQCRKLLMMDILMSETCWAHKKWNKIASDIKLVFHSSTMIVFVQISDRHHRLGRNPWRRSRWFLNNEGVKSVIGVVTVTNSRYGRLELYADLGRDLSLRQSLQNGPEAYPPSCSIDTGLFFPGIKAGGTWS